jgi:alkylation response protein AidB-like acyl-CoA dehydrogenase
VVVDRRGDPSGASRSIVMGKTDPQRSEAPAAVDDPRALGHAGVKIERNAHRLRLRRRAARARRGDVRPTCACRRSNLLLGEGRGFEIAQGRLGPGTHPPLHALDRRWPSARSSSCAGAWTNASRVRTSRSSTRARSWQERIAESRIAIEQARLLTLKAAWMMDTVGNKAARPRSR